MTLKPKEILATTYIGKTNGSNCGKYDSCDSDCGSDTCNDCNDEQCGSDCNHD